MIDKLLHYRFNKDEELFEHWCDSDINIKRTKDREKLCEYMAHEIYIQSCGDQPFPIVLHIHDEKKKHLGSYKVDLDLEPVFTASKEGN